MGIGFKKMWKRKETAWMKISQHKIVYFPAKHLEVSAKQTKRLI